jgi:hypothetical protein
MQSIFLFLQPQARSFAPHSVTVRTYSGIGVFSDHCPVANTGVMPEIEGRGMLHHARKN